MHDIFVNLNFRRFLVMVLKGSPLLVPDLRSLPSWWCASTTKAHLLHDQTHFRTDMVLRGVNWRNREITAFHARTMAGLCCRLRTGRGVPAPSISSIATCEPEIDAPKRMSSNRKNSGSGSTDGIGVIPVAAQVAFRTCFAMERVTVITCMSCPDVATDNQGRVREERVNHCGGCVWHQHHVGFVNAFQYADRGQIQHFYLLQRIRHLPDEGRNRDIMFFAFEGIGEAQIDKLRFDMLVPAASRQNIPADILVLSRIGHGQSSW